MKHSWKKYKNNIPHRVKVNRLKDNEILYTDDFKDGKTRGEARLHLNQILLLNGQSPKDMVHTLYHELLHVWSEEFGANLTESQVLAMEHSLPYVIELVNTLNGVKKYVKKS
jgi:Zn-dependent peptidase ImmA (M78 family)